MKQAYESYRRSTWKYVMALIIEERERREWEAMQSCHLVAKLGELFEGWCRINHGLLAQLESRGLCMSPLDGAER